ncbi:MAG: glycosyltransferase family 4 protein [Pseudomonadota bacterium]
MIFLATQCFPPALGGIETYMGGLADAIAGTGGALVVYADGADDTVESFDPGFRYPVIRFTGWRPLRRRRKIAALRRAILLEKPDRILCDSWKSVETVAASLGSGPRPRLVTLAHGMEFPSRPSASKRARIAAALSHADAILANSPFTAERVAATLALNGADSAQLVSRIKIVTPPLAPTTARAPAAGGARHAEPSALAATRPLIAAMGRLEPRKGFDQLIRAASVLAVDYPDLTVALAGDGPDQERLKALASETRAPVRFLGRISEEAKATLLSEADLFAMPCRAEGDSVEGFGIVYLEAAWAGAPSLAGRAGGAAAAVREGETGWLCDGDDLADVERVLREILADPKERARRGAAAAAHARAQLWPARIGDYLEA